MAKARKVEFRGVPRGCDTMIGWSIDGKAVSYCGTTQWHNWLSFLAHCETWIVVDKEHCMDDHVPHNEAEVRAMFDVMPTYQKREWGIARAGQFARLGMKGEERAIEEIKVACQRPWDVDHNDPL